tara:strand:+ start:266551 stop:267588 length:1038 start_codon:yes stop_codon:yes gene_type:complete
LERTVLQYLHTKYKENSLYGKWIRHEQITPLLEEKKASFQIENIGSSEEGRSIHSLRFGNGPMKVLIWTQMHGNESTGTKAVFDLINTLASDHELSQVVKQACTLQIIPMLNPDGAERYTRVNANEVDLNRDAVAVSAKESKVLRKVLDDFQPKFCFNMHDQRTIFGVEGTTNPATLSFLAPSEEVTKQLTKGRKETMNVIVAMNAVVQHFIPNHVGRYTDEFYPTATGDNFQKMGYNTILIESGHYPKDYVREKSREFTFYALLSGLHHIATSKEFSDYEPYFDIPNNNKDFLDVIHRFSNKADEGYQYVDEILENQLVSRLVKEEIFDVSDKIGHFEIVFDNE